MEKLLKDLWNDKPLLIVVVVIVGVLVYLLWKNNQSAIIAPGGTQSGQHERRVGHRHGTFPIPTGQG